MKLLFDTNIILDTLLAREPFVQTANKLVAAVERSQLEGYLGAATLTTIFYLANRALSTDDARGAVRQLLSLYNVAPVNRATLESALDIGFSDYEDAVLHEAGVQGGVSAIVTRNPKDFKRATLRIYSPEEVVAALKL